MNTCTCIMYKLCKKCTGGGGGEVSEMNARVVLLYPEIKATAANYVVSIELMICLSFKI